jgi:hypothetical protein
MGNNLFFKKEEVRTVISRENFMFTVGYQGNSAIVDGMLKNRYGKMSTEELMKKGLFKPALCSAIYSGNNDESELVLTLYNENAAEKLSSLEDLKRILGVSRVPEDIESHCDLITYLF